MKLYAWILLIFLPAFLRGAVTGESLQQMARKTIAELNLPYQDNQNPLIAQAQDELLASITSHMVVHDQKVIKKIEMAAFAQLIGNAHPHADLDKLSAVVEFAAWLFIYDDIIEKQKKQQTIETLHARTMEILKGAQVASTDITLNRWFHDIVARIHNISGSATWNERFRKDIQDYFQATLWEFANRKRGKIPTLAAYRKNRPNTSATKVMFDFIELMEGAPIPQEIFESDYFHQMLILGLNLVNWENDILSAPKEFLNADIHNLVFVHQASENISYEEAFEKTALDLSEDLNQFMTLAQEVPDYGPHTEAVNRYIEGIMNWVSAHHFWAIASARYVVK